MSRQRQTGSWEKLSKSGGSIAKHRPARAERAGASESQTLPNTSQLTFTKVAECLYRNESSGIYYALVKRHSKQFRRSLKTSDRQLANRRLAEFRNRVTRLAAEGCGDLPLLTQINSGPNF